MRRCLPTAWSSDPGSASGSSTAIASALAAAFALDLLLLLLFFAAAVANAAAVGAAVFCMRATTTCGSGRTARRCSLIFSARFSHRPTPETSSSRRELSARTSRTLLAFWSAARIKIDDRNETSGFSCWSAFAYQTLFSEGGKTLSKTDASDGGALRTVEDDDAAVSARCGETGSATTWVANVIAEIQREDRRGSRDEGKRDQKLQQYFQGSVQVYVSL